MATTYAIPNGRTVMDATTFTGDGTNPRTIVNADNGTTGFKPDLIWQKARNQAYYGTLFDSVRGFSDTKALYSANSASEGTYAYGYTSAANSNGFSVATGNAGNLYSNENNTTYVAWQWQAGQGTTSSNTSGSITSTVSVNTTAGFSVVTYTGTGSAATVGHGLGATPSMMIVKCRNTAGTDWPVYHASLGATGIVALDSTSGFITISTPWSNTAPTSSVMTIGTSGDTNGSGRTYVAYCWAPVAGFSQFGSYTGNGSTDGPFIYTGFRPKFVMIKRTSAAGYWYMYDSSRAPYNENQSIIQAQDPQAEYTGVPIDFVSNGFKLRTTDIYANANGFNFIYMAFAENPFKYANAR